jgi:hypothetical protein
LRRRWRAGRHHAGDRAQRTAGGARHRRVANKITDVNRGAGETGVGSGQVSNSAQLLANESNRLKSEVDRFLIAVRAA